jgi:hypothetical protein
MALVPLLAFRHRRGLASGARVLSSDIQPNDLWFGTVTTASAFFPIAFFFDLNSLSSFRSVLIAQGVWRILARICEFSTESRSISKGRIHAIAVHLLRWEPVGYLVLTTLATLWALTFGEYISLLQRGFLTVLILAGIFDLEFFSGRTSQTQTIPPYWKNPKTWAALITLVGLCSVTGGIWAELIVEPL